MDSIRKLKLENKRLKETCEILSNKQVLNEINKSLKEISNGKYVRLSEL